MLAGTAASGDCTSKVTIHAPSLTLAAVGAALALQAGTAFADDASAAAYADIEATLGSVPSLFSAFPEVGIAGAWTEFKSVQLNPDTALDGKTKELMGLAVASQIPCAYCVYFHTAAAKANGATDEEIKEAVAMAAIVRHWSTVMNGMRSTSRLPVGDRRDLKRAAYGGTPNAGGKPMLTTTKPVNGALLKQAIEGRDGRMLATSTPTTRWCGSSTAITRRASRARCAARRRSTPSGTTSAAGR